jgi:hypothetical protein
MLHSDVTMEIGLLKEWNPWWIGNKEIPNELKGKDRLEYNDLVNSVTIREITIITGVRRSGKSTLMYQMIDRLLSRSVNQEQILFVDLEDKKLFEYSLEDIYSCYRETINPDKKAFIFLDEIHRKPGWESWIRKLYDLKEECKFVISGSCSYLLRKAYSTLLTGRNLTFTVYPLSFNEFLGFKNIKIRREELKKGLVLDRVKHKIINLLNKYINTGGFPEIFFKPEDYKFKVLKQYFDDMLYKDIIDRHNITAKKTEEIALFLMTNFTNFISLRNLRNSLDISYDTIKDNLSYYEEAFMFFTLDHFSYSLKEQKTLPSKIYCIDNGLRNAVSFKFSKDYGKLAENLVFIELKRRNKDLYYWKGKGEADFVVKNEEQTLSAVNVTYSDKIDEREINGLLEFKKKFGKKVKKLIILTKDIEKKESGIEFIPLWKWLLLTE